MYKPLRYLTFTLICLPLLGSVCASTHQSLSEQNAHADTVLVSTQERKVPVAAIVKAHKVNLRDKPSKSGSVVETLNQGQLLALIQATPVGPWYRVRDSKSDSEGWVHGNTIALLRTTELAPANASSPERPRRTSPPVSGRSYVNVDGVRVPSPVFSETKPSGATARCRDGSYSFSQHRRGTCSYHGGVAEWY